MTDNLAFHFTGNTLRDGSPLPAIGETLRYDGKIALCESGYHWSKQPFDALQYAPGCLLHLVRYGGDVCEVHDKGVSSERTILATIDATDLLRRFAADQALSVAHLWPMPDIVRDYLTTLDDSKREAAWDSASAARAAQSATWAAVRHAAWAAQSATWAAARHAAWAAAWHAAWSAARSAARAAACGADRDDFNCRVYAAFSMADEK